MSAKPQGGENRNSYRDQLWALAVRLTAGVAVLTEEVLRPTGADGTAAEGPARQEIVSSSEGDEEVARSVLLSEANTLEEVYAALARLDAGMFGKCEQCGRAITKTRLDAIPYARYCISCAGVAQSCETH